MLLYTPSSSELAGDCGIDTLESAISGSEHAWKRIRFQGKATATKKSEVWNEDEGCLKEFQFLAKVAIKLLHYLPQGKGGQGKVGFFIRFLLGKKIEATSSVLSFKLGKN